ncbi:hypothetical protein CHS0354_033258 [Potamilus streckersoni]|uniref:Uncharacterized protein n=1 Tax=Potamilus streckersoni TaxID=2493646 RepID=A0AAE0S6K7_9BIVA|nr:hypothetical protein CHS0354_033258 [Potamilus streckersoni]
MKTYCLKKNAQGNVTIYFYCIAYKLSPAANCTDPDVPLYNVPADLSLHFGVISRTNSVGHDLQALKTCIALATSKLGHMYHLINIYTVHYPGMCILSSTALKSWSKLSHSTGLICFIFILF